MANIPYTKSEKTEKKWTVGQAVNYPQFVDLKIYNEGQLCTFPIGEL